MKIAVLSSSGNGLMLSILKLLLLTVLSLTLDDLRGVSSVAAAYASRPVVAGRRRTASAPPPGGGLAIGLLSPEMVARMDEEISNNNNKVRRRRDCTNRTSPPPPPPPINPDVVERFLRTYRQESPMPCLEMLSDPDVLPHLARAMRDIT